MSEPASARPLVLVVEDDAGIRDALIDSLDVGGYDAIAAADGREALEALRSSPRRPDLILLDLMMPVVDGWQFRAAQLDDHALAAIPVVVLTAHPSPDEARVLKAAGHLKKPISLDRLLETVGRLVSAPPARAP